VHARQEVLKVLRPVAVGDEQGQLVAGPLLLQRQRGKRCPQRLETICAPRRLFDRV